jgi:single-strand DNA-binding protein
MNLNKVFLIGRLTVDPQLRSTAGGQPVASFGLATNRVWTDKAGAKQESVEFHNIVVWGRQAEIASKFLIKGSLALIEGRLQTRAWDDKQGQKRRTTEIIAERIQLGPRPGGGGGSFAKPTPMSEPSASGPALEEIPTITVDEEIKSDDLPF